MRLLTITIAACMITTSFAQQGRIVQDFADSLQLLRNETVATSYVSPYYYRLVDPTTYYAGAMNHLFQLADSTDSTNDQTGPFDSTQLIQEIDRQLASLYLLHPNYVVRHDGVLDQVTLVDEQEAAKQQITNEVNSALQANAQAPAIDDVAEDIDDIGLQVQRPNFWTKSGKFGLQFTQNYFSENWYKGGNNTQSMLASLLLEAKYDDQKRITWENRLDMRLGFVTTTSDSCHTFLTNTDKINLHSKLGVKATRNAWFYTATLEANTQFLPGHRTNDRRTYSQFLSPLDFFFSLGMDYKPKLKNGNELSVALLPLSYKFRYISSEDDNIHRVYNLVGRDFKQDFGSKVEFRTKFKLAKDFTWKSRFYYFTSYEYAESEFENVFSYQLSKYISTELFTLWRFDDNRSRDYYDDNLGYFQFQQYFTLGLTYSF